MILVTGATGTVGGEVARQLIAAGHFTVANNVIVNHIARWDGAGPGFARDELVAIAKRLERSVPHFLPSFWEEAGRAFAREESRSCSPRPRVSRAPSR